MVLEWDPIELATADLISLSLYRNGQKAGNIPRPLQMHSTKISGLAVDTEYTFHLVLRTTAGTRTSEKVTVRTHKMTDLSGVTITTGILPAAARERLTMAVERIGAKIVDGVRIDTTHFVTTEGRGTAWEKAVEMNIPVVRPEWVDACEKNGRILGVTKFYLDAMRPGPPSEEQISSPPPPPAPPKDETPSADASHKVAEATSEAGERERGHQEDDESEIDEENDKMKQHDAVSANADHHSEQDDKTDSQADDLQKLTLEDKEEQTVALQSRSSSAQGDAANDTDSDQSQDQDQKQDKDKAENEDQDKEGGLTVNEAEGKPAITPDRASFQEVEL